MSPVTRASLAYLAFGIAVAAIVPYLPVYYQSVGLDLGAIGALTALAAAVQLIASPAWGGLSDRFASSRAIPFAAPVVAAIAALALAGAAGMPAIVVCVAALSAGIAGIGPLLDARTLDILGASRPRYGRVRAWASAGFVAGSWLIGILIDRTSATSIFAVWIPAVMVTALVTVALPSRSHTQSPSVIRGMWGLLRERNLALFLFGALLVWTGLAAANSFFSVYIVSLGAPAQAVGLAWAVGALVEVPVMWTFPSLAQRVGATRLLVMGAAAFAVRAAGAALLASPEGLVATMAVEGFAYGVFWTGGVMYVAQHSPKTLAATAQGLFGSASGLAIVVGGSVGGVVASALTLRGLFAVCAGVSALAAVVVWLAVRPSGHVAAEPVTVTAAGA